MSQKLTPALRREVILATGLCTNPNCTAHDDIVLRIWQYKREAEDRGFELGEISSEQQHGIQRIRP